MANANQNPQPTPDEDQIEALFDHIRPTPGQRLDDRMAVMPWNRTPLSEREQIMRLTRLLRISTIAAVFFALLSATVSAYALSLRAELPLSSAQNRPGAMETPMAILPDNYVAVSIPNQDYENFPPDIQVGDMVYYLIPSEGDHAAEAFLNELLGEDFLRPHALGFHSTQGIVVGVNNDLPGMDSISIAATSSDILWLVNRIEARQSVKPTMIIPGDSIPPDHFAWTTAIRQDDALHAGDHVRAWVDIFTVPYCLGCPDSDASPEDVVICQNLLADDVEIMAISTPPASMKPSEEEQSSLQIVTLAVPESERKTFDKPINRPYWPVRLEAVDAPENTQWPSCNTLSAPG